MSSRVERIIPEIIFDWSLHFKTAVIMTGAIVVLFSSVIRPEVSILIWGPILLLGGLLEWMIVATVYLEMEQLENDIDSTYREVKNIEREIIETENKVEIARNRLQGLANETYDIEDGRGQFQSLEPGGFSSPEDVDFQSYEETAKERLNHLEKKVEDLEREIGDSH